MYSKLESKHDQLIRGLVISIIPTRATTPEHERNRNNPGEQRPGKPEINLNQKKCKVISEKPHKVLP